MHFLIVAISPFSINENDGIIIRLQIFWDHLHLVDDFFNQRIRGLLEYWFLWYGLAVEWSSFIIEYQKQGTAHAHGCVRLNSFHGDFKIANDVLEGMIVEDYHRKYYQIPIELFVPEEFYEGLLDDWGDEEYEFPSRTFSLSDIQKIIPLFEKGQSSVPTIG